MLAMLLQITFEDHWWALKCYMLLMRHDASCPTACKTSQHITLRKSMHAGDCRVGSGQSRSLLPVPGNWCLSITAVELRNCLLVMMKATRRYASTRAVAALIKTMKYNKGKRDPGLIFFCCCCLGAMQLANLDDEGTLPSKQSALSPDAPGSTTLYPACRQKL